MIKTVSYTHTNSYETLFELTDQTKNIWICFHGLGYLSTYFKRYFESFDPIDNFVIVPQAPSKSYLGEDFKHVGACWLTKVDTDQEMSNNINYIDKVLSAENIQGDGRIILMGYSQGVSIATRYLKHYNQDIKALILHSGSIPQELNANDGVQFRKQCSKFIHIAGTLDEYSNEEIIKREVEKIKLLFGTDCELHRPEIKHVVHVPLLKEIAQKLILMEIIFATHNQNKLIEVQALMPSHIKLISLENLGFKEDIPETSGTIAGNAIQKVEFLKNRFSQPIFADDTGLLVTSLNNEPGVYSARYAGEQKNSEDNMDLLLHKLTNNNNRAARFVTAIALDLNNNQTLFEGVCEGTILKERRGSKGFGYDPIFQPNGFDTSFGEMTLTEKGTVSHRAKALRKLIDYLKEVN